MIERLIRVRVDGPGVSSSSVDQALSVGMESLLIAFAGADQGHAQYELLDVAIVPGAQLEPPAPAPAE